ncbi:Lipopolysaccharide export system protein LptA [Halomonadaceae bacterium LMG 33818]|uniref:lipopolysaccharide transport periplasmic protein LptA n=1 Tax=Cernens ardua TaxID=3402176 RepID=UPI003EDBA4AA
MMQARFIASLLVAGSMVAGSIAAPALAAAPDTSLPIHVVSNQLTADNNSKVVTYTGNVHVTQGGLTLDADRVNLYLDNSNNLVRVKATGTANKRAFVQQAATATAPLMRGWGNVINYWVTQHKMDMQGNAELHRGTDTFTGPFVEYYIDSRRVNANGSGNNAKGGSTGDASNSTSGRVNMTFTPSSNGQSKTGGSSQK